jgi:hypothetical protein
MIELTRRRIVAAGAIAAAVAPFAPMCRAIRDIR